MNEKAELLWEIYEVVIGKNKEPDIYTPEGLKELQESAIRVKVFNELYAKFGDGIEK